MATHGTGLTEESDQFFKYTSLKPSYPALPFGKVWIYKNIGVVTLPRTIRIYSMKQ